MKDRLSQIVRRFQRNLDTVDTLLTFDSLLQDICLKGLHRAKRGLDSFGNQNERFSVNSTITLIEKIRDNASMRPNYEIMYNQCVVLMISYLSSALEDIFKEAFDARIISGNLGSLESEELRITIGQLRRGNVAEVFLQKKNDISFQDMQSTLRSFEDYIGVERMDRSQATDNIILAQAMRHCIVHNGCIINERTLGQLRSANKRTLKLTVNNNERVQFSEEEVRQVKSDILSFVNTLSHNVLDACP